VKYFEILWHGILLQGVGRANAGYSAVCKKNTVVGDRCRGNARRSTVLQCPKALRPVLTRWHLSNMTDIVKLRCTMFTAMHSFLTKFLLLPAILLFVVVGREENVTNQFDVTLSK